MRGLWHATVAALLLMARAQDGCETHCATNDCTNLNGNLTQECGGCTEATAKCHPDADGFSTWGARRASNETLVEEDKARGYEHVEL